jgi:hypothetical protein
MRSNTWKANKNTAMAIAIIACMMLAASTSSFAVPASQISRVPTFMTFVGVCCTPWGQTVQITEPAEVVPVIVTWSSDVWTTDESIVGLSLNGGFCTAYGSREIPAQGSNGFTNTTHQWALLPSDGLKKGPNTFALCGGAVRPGTDILNIWLSTLTVQTSK